MIRLKKKRYIILASIASALFLAGNIYLIVKDDSKIPRTAMISQKASVTMNHLQDTLHTKGIVVPNNEISIYYDPKLGVIDEIFVNEGDEVQIGTPLIRYQNMDLEKQLNELEALKEQAVKKEELLQERIAQLEAILEETKNTNEEMNDAYLLSIENEISNQQLQLIEQENEIEQYDSRIDFLNEKKEQLLVTSTQAGIVKKINQNNEKPLLSIVSSTPIISGKIAEKEFSKVEMGQKVEIQSDFLPKKVFKGSIQTISNIPEQASLESKSMYPYTAQIDGDVSQLHYGYHVDVTIVTKEKNHALTIPKEALIKIKGKHYVFVLKNGKLDMKKVELGMKVASIQEIKNGLEEGDIIVLNPTKKLVDGKKFITPINIKDLNKNDYKELTKKEKIKLLLNGLLS